MITYDSKEAAEVKTVTGWVSRLGRFWGKDEHMARWEGCTHTKCSVCGKYIEKSRIKCSECSTKKDVDKYYKKPHKDWDGETVLYSHYFDKYFRDEETLKEDCEEAGIKVSESMLVLCEPEYLHEIDTDIWEDIFPDDTGNECIPANVMDALDKLNEEIRDAKNLDPICWMAGRYRTNILGS